MTGVPERFRPVHGRLIVSCQALEGDPFHGPEHMARFARAAVAGGAAAIRANGPEDVGAIVAAVPVPVLGIQKRVMPDGRVLITPTLEDAAVLVTAGAAAVALDCTLRGQAHGALDRLYRIRHDMGVPVAADIATLDEAVAAARAGADFVLSTMRGYTDETSGVTAFEPEFIHLLVRSISVPVIAEGRIWTRQEVQASFAAGAFAVVVGSAVTRPRDITAHLVSAIPIRASEEAACVLAIDLGGTRIKAGIVAASGEVTCSSTVATCVGEGRAGLLRQLASVARGLVESADSRGLRPRALGVAAAGWIDAERGEVVYGTANLPDWTGAPIGATLAEAIGLQVFVENDANAAAMAEKRFGAAAGVRSFVSITLGTGVGAGCYSGGRLLRGAHSMANALGHLTIEPGGELCTCGRRGCLEAYANSAALLRYARPAVYDSAEDLIAAANRGEPAARGAVAALARHLARGCEQAIQLLDPELIVFSGGLAQDNPLLLAGVEAALARSVPLWERRGVQLRVSPLGYFGGVAGAAAAAFERLG